MNEFIKKNKLDANVRIDSTKGPNEAAHLKSDDQSISIGIKTKTGIKAGAHVRIRRNKVFKVAL